MKINLDVENNDGLGVKKTMKKDKKGEKLHENECVQNSTQSMVKVTLPKEIKKFNLDIEKAGGLGLKTIM